MKNINSGLNNVPGHSSISTAVTATRIIIAAITLIFVAGCGSILKRDTLGKTSSATTGKSGIAAKKGGYYLDDGPGDNPPADLASIPDATPRNEPLRPVNMRPYVALGKSYTPMTALKPYRARGLASWYGRRYHGQKTASGEVYDMYTMTAAHTTLPLPSYARVTNVRNGKSVVVRVNDRGPFHSDRLIDLSYTAAYKLGVLDGGSVWVEVESILPGAESVVRVAAAPASAPVTPREKISPALSSIAEKQNNEAKAKPDLLIASIPATATGTSGIYLQLGAFSAYDNADNFLTRMRTALPSLSDTLDIIAADGLFKVHAGPYPDQLLARQAADKIAQALSVKPMLLVR